jgi:kynurenine formamidase
MTSTSRLTTEAEVDELARELSNWGRWGDEDERGTLNLITERNRLAAAGCIRTGSVHSLALELRGDLPQPAGSGRLNAQHVMTATGAGTGTDVDDRAIGYADDTLTIAVHGATHWDALAHVFHRGWMYNARPSAAVTAAGAAANDIVPVARTMVTRGVLVDVARHRGVPALEPDAEVTVSDLEATLDAQRVSVSEGDALLIRTGHLGRIRAAGDWASFTEVDEVPPREPGIGAAALGWLHEHGISAIACDNWAVEWLTGPDVVRMPVHEVGIVHMGLLLGEMFELDELARACTADGCFDFLLAAGPLPIRGGVGGPVNPLAIR